MQRQRAEQQAAQVLQQKAEVLDKVKHRFRRAIGNEDDEPEEGAGDAGALEDEKQQVSLHPCKAWRSLQTGRHFDVSICGASTNHRRRRRMSNRQAEAVRNRAGNSGHCALVRSLWDC